MTKLNFEYVDASNEERANYRGYIVRAIRDDDAINPFTEYDCEPPLVSYSGRYGGDMNEYGEGALDCLAGVKPAFYSRNWRKLCAILSLDPAAHDKEARDDAKAYGCGLSDTRMELLERELNEAEQGSKGDYLEMISAIWGLRGVVAKSFTSTGYSQGDYAECLAVATPAWAEKVGAPKDSHASQLDYAAKLFGYWTWGDCYYWAIANDDDDMIENCSGYYGSDHDESGLADAAIEAIDYLIQTKAKARLACLKTLIRNRVPLALRPALLESAE